MIIKDECTVGGNICFANILEVGHTSLENYFMLWVLSHVQEPFPWINNNCINL